MSVSLRTAFAAFAGIAILAACRGGTGAYMPPGSNPAGAAVVRTYQSPPPCGAKPMKLPRKALVFVSFGTVSGGDFSGTKLYSQWELSAFSKGTPPPTTSPSPSPPPPPEYLYYGTFAALHHAAECAYLLTTQNGKPLPGSQYNGEAQGFPNIQAPYYKEKLIDLGQLEIDIHGLSPSGGQGSFTMRNIAGKTVYTGTVALSGRISEP
jgi:hypothetical protein